MDFDPFFGAPSFTSPPGPAAEDANSTATPAPAASTSKVAASTGSSWFGSVLTSVLQSSEQLLEATKRDLSEFVHVIQHDTQQVVADSAQLIHGRMQKLQQEEELARAQSGEEGKDAGKSLTSTVSGFFGSITASIASAAAPAPATALASGSLGSAGAASGSSLTQGAAMPTSRADALLVALQTNPATYTADIPANQRQRYDAWVSTANVDAMTEQISQLLGDHPEVRTLHTKLVPSTISYTLFWQHYFFRVHLLREEERNRAKLKERMESSVIEDVDWDDDDDPTPTRQDTPPSQTAPPLSQDSSTSTLRTVLSAVEQPATAPAVTTARQRSSEAPSDDDDEIHQILQTSRSPVATLAPEPAAPPKAAPLQPSPFSGLPAPFSSEPALNTPASAVLSHASSRSTSTTSTESFELVLPGNNSGMVVTTNATGTTTRVSHPPAAVGGDVEDDDWETWE